MPSVKFELLIVFYCSIINHSKVINQALSIEKVVGGDQKVPRKRAEPWQTMNFVDSITNVDNLSKTFHLHCQYL